MEAEEATGSSAKEKEFRPVYSLIQNLYITFGRPAQGELTQKEQH